MRRLLKRYEIGPEFMDILLAMGNKPRESEAGIRRTVTKEREDGVFGNTKAQKVVHY